jgi:hypothetical protein
MTKKKTTPFDGIEIMRPDRGLTTWEGELRPINLALIVWQNENYIYHDGMILGPVGKLIDQVSLNKAGNKDKEPPSVVRFGQGDKVGVYVDGVRSRLFDQTDAFKFDGQHFWYRARLGKKWCYVIDGVLHGWFDELSQEWIRFRGDELVFWAIQDGQVGYWVNDVLTRGYDASYYSLSNLTWHGDKLIYRVTQSTGTPRCLEGVFYEGEVTRWFARVEKITYDADGLTYIGCDSEDKYLVFGDDCIGPYDEIVRYPSLAFGLEAGHLAAKVSKQGKEAVLVDNWITDWFDNIYKINPHSDHLIVIGVNHGEPDLFTYYVDGKFVICVDKKGGFIKGEELCFRESLEIITGHHRL